MPKYRKRTISELLKDRPDGRFISGGFDLLGEGARMVAEMDDDLFLQKPVPHPIDQESGESAIGSAQMHDLALKHPGFPEDLSAIEDPAIAAIASMLYAREANLAIENNAIASSSIDDSAMAKDAIEFDAIAGNVLIEEVDMETSAIAGHAVGNFAIENNAIEEIAIASTAIVDCAIADPAVVELSIAGSAIEFSAIEGSATDLSSTKIKKSSKKLKGLATREAYHKSHEEIERLKTLETATLVDNHVFDTLFKEINNPSEAIVYLYLWRRTRGSGEKSVELSYQVLSDAIGISKRAGQDVLKRLGEKKLVKINRESKTGIPSYEVLQPWNKK